MADSGPHLTRDQILEEIDFQQIIITTVDPGADDYSEQVARINGIIQELEEKLDQLSDNDNRPSSGHGSNGAVSETASGQPMVGKRQHSEISSPVRTGSQSEKRSRLNETGSPSQKSHYFLEQQRQILRQAEQEKMDLELAKSWAYDTGPRQSSFSPAQSSSQAILNRDLSYRNTMANSRGGPSSSSVRRVFKLRDPESELDSVNAVLSNPSSSSTNPARVHQANLPFHNNPTSPVPNRHGQLAAISPMTSIKSDPSPRPAGDARIYSAPGSGWTTPSSSTSSDLVEIAPESFTPRNMASGSLRSNRMPNGQLNSVKAEVAGQPVFSRPGGQSSGNFSFQPASTYLNPFRPAPDLLGSNTAYPMPGSFPFKPEDPINSFYDEVPRTNLAGEGLAQAGKDFEAMEGGHDARFDYIYSNPGDTTEEIGKLLENIRPDEDIPPEEREGTPPELAVALLEHQKLGLAWLKRQEEGTSKGGILADDMGLGKTIQALALMVARPSRDPERKTNLIVAPVALLRQWEQEIKEKIRSNKALKVYRYHGQAKKSFDYLKNFDVVLTTFGSLAAELKRKLEWDQVLLRQPNALPGPRERLNLIGDDCKWYRVIIDEAQCIKNKETQTAKASLYLKARYRLCMTGTPMMNNVTELYSLIRFCRIKPFNEWDHFRDTIKNPLGDKGASQLRRDNAMKRLQGLVRAVMLRRNKKSKLDGKPLIALPERTTERADVEFDEEQNAFYQGVEGKLQLQFNRYLKAGSVMKNYASILVLLLRLRQACCHPHLIRDFDESPVTELPEETRMQSAKALSEDVVQRIKDAAGNFECPICFDAVENPAIIFPCGHALCTECLSRLTDPAEMIARGDEGGTAKCPECRGALNPRKLLDFLTFRKVFQPELLSEEERGDVKEEVADDSDSDSSDDDSSEDDDDGSLNGFIVGDDVTEEAANSGTDDDEAPEEDALPKGKGKMKAERNAFKFEPESDDDYEDLSRGVKPEKEVRAGPSKSGDDEDFELVKADDSDTGSAGAGAERTKSEKKETKEKKPQQAATGKKSGGKKPQKGKKKAKQGPKKTLAQLKKESMRNKDARKKYFRRLRKTFVSSAKLDQMMDLLHHIHEARPGDKVLIFSQFTSLLDLAEIPISDHGYGLTRYDGSMKPGERDDSVTRFRANPNVTVMLVSLKAGNAGLNLTIANHVIMLDPFWNPYIEEQAIDRAHRIGQTKPVLVHRLLIPGTVEDRILELQKQKRELIDTALDENAGKSISRLGLNELCYLFGLNRRGG